MKKNRVMFFGIAAVIAVMFTLTGCSNPVGGGEKLQAKNLTIAGTFKSQGGVDGGAKFFATAGSGARSVRAARAISGTDFALDGYLEDGDIVFRLKGNYNSDTKTYTLSAASSILRYTISGGFNNDGTAETGKAVVQVKSGEEWVTHELEVTTAETAPELDMNKEQIDETEGGIPMNMRGIWRDYADASYYAVVNAYSVIIYEKAGSTWVESETLYFTDIDDIPSGGVSGITAYMGWDYDKLATDTAYQWHSDMLIDYAKTKNPGKTPVTDTIGLSSKYLESLMTGPGGGIDKVKAAFNTLGSAYSAIVGDVNHNEEWKYRYMIPQNGFEQFQTDMAVFNAEFQEIWQWVIDNHHSDFNDYLTTDEYKSKLATLLAKYPSLQAKYQITLFYNDEWDLVYSGEPVPPDFYDKFQSLITTWANSNGYIIIDFLSLSEEIWTSGYEEIWLNKWIADNGKNKNDYYVQWYQKMALKLQGGKLYYGSYYKPHVGGILDQGGFWWPTGDGIGQYPPVWSVSNFSETNTLTTLEWEPYGLSR